MRLATRWWNRSRFPERQPQLAITDRSGVGNQRRTRPRHHALGVLVAALAASLGLAGMAQAGPAIAADPDGLLVSDSFGRSREAGWGNPSFGDRWLHPTGSGGLSVASGDGIMEHRQRGSARLATINTSVRDVSQVAEIGLNRLPGGGGVKIMNVARKSAAGEYRVGVRIGDNGKMWLSASKAIGSGDAQVMAAAVPISELRYSPGQRVKLKSQVIKQDPTQIRAKIWLSGSAEPTRWQLVLNDYGNDISRGGRIGIRSVVTEGAAVAAVEVRVDSLQVNRARDVGQVDAIDGSSGSTPKPTPKATPKPTPKATPAPANVVNVPSSIDSTGGSDVRTALQSVMDKAPNGSTIVFKAGGRYRIDKALRISGKRNLTLDGNGARLDLPRTDQNYDSIGILLQNATGTTIRDLLLVGNNSQAGTTDPWGSRENNHGIAVLSASDTLIEGVELRRVWGDCFYLSQTSTGAPANGVTIRGSTCRLAGRHGVGLIAADDVRILDNTFDEIGFMIVDIEPNNAGQGADGVVLRGNDIGSYGLTGRYVGWVLGACGADGSVVRDVTVRDNTVAGNRAGYDGRMYGVHVRVCGDRGTRANFTVTGNVGQSTVKGPALLFTEVNGVTVTGNTQPLSGGSLATFPGSSNVTYDR